MTRRAGYTSAPCHGCGRTELHPKDSVCSTCATQLKTYATIVANQAESSDRKIFSMPERYYAIPYMSHEPNGKNSRDSIRGPLHDLAMILSEPTTERVQTYIDRVGYIDEVFLWGYEKNAHRHEWQTFRTMNPVVARLLRELQLATQQGLAAAHRKGTQEGRNLLMSLADGSITNDQFNERAARLDEEGRQ